MSITSTRESPDELAAFLGNTGEPQERAAMYPRVRKELSSESAAFWDEHVDTVEAGILHCGGAERCYATVRSHLGTDDLTRLAQQPEVVAAAFRAGLTIEAMETHMSGMPRPAMQHMVEHGVPAIAAQCSARLAELTDGEPDLVVEIILRGAYPMDPPSSRPQFLRQPMFDAMRQNGCGSDRISFHHGPLQSVGPALARERGAYDFVDMSNILDMAPPDQAPGVVENVKAAVGKGGHILCRAHAPNTLAPLFESCGLTVDEELSARARAAESSFFINDVCVAHT